MIVIIRNTDVQHRLFCHRNTLVLNIIRYCDGRHVTLNRLFPILDHKLNTYRYVNISKIKQHAFITFNDGRFLEQ